MVLATLHESFMEHHGINQNERHQSLVMRNLDLKMLLKKNVVMKKKFNQGRKSNAALQNKKTVFNKILNESASSFFTKDYANQTQKSFFQSIQQSYFYFAVKQTNICIQVVVLSLDGVSISNDQLRVLYIIDFATTMILFLEIPIELLSFGWRKYWKEQLNKLDFCLALAHLIMYCVESYNGLDVFLAQNNYSIFIRTAKILRIYRLIYTLSIFQSIKIILKTYSKTLKMITGYFIVISILITLYALIGRELFSMRANYEEFMINFNSLTDSFIAVILFCFDEEWHILMYEYYHQVGYKSMIFCILCSYTCSVIMVSLFIAIFINNFMDWLRYFEDQIYTPSSFITMLSNLTSILYNKLKSYLLQAECQSILNQNMKQLQIDKLSPKQIANNDENSIKQNESPNIIISNAKNSKFSQIALQNQITAADVVDNNRKYSINKANFQQISVLPVIYQKSVNQDNQNGNKIQSIFNRKNTTNIEASPFNNTVDISYLGYMHNKKIELVKEDTNNNQNLNTETDCQNFVTTENDELKEEEKGLFEDKEVNQQQISLKKSEYKQESDSQLGPDDQIAQQAKLIQDRQFQNLNSPEKKSDQNDDQEYKKQEESSSQIQAQNQSQVYVVSVKEYSFFIFSQQNWFRILCKKIVDTPIFNKLKVVLLMLFGLILAILDPYLDIYSSFGQFLIWADFGIMILFNVQTIIYSIAYGPILYLGNKQFDLNINNFLEILFNILHILCFVSFSSKAIYVLRISKIFRLLLLLPFLQNYFTQIDFAIRVCKACLPRMFKIMMFGIIFTFINSVFVTKLFKAQMNYCEYDKDIIKDTIILTDKDCMDVGGDWVEYLYQFKNVLSSISVLLMVQTSEAWTLIMYQQFDYTSESTQPKKEHQSFWILFYIQFFCIANFCILNMFVGVVVDTYKELKESETKINKLTHQQKEWYYIKQSIYRLEISKQISPPNDKIGKLIYEALVNKKYFKYFFNFFTVLNCVSIFSYSHRQEQKVLNVLNYINLCCIIIFCIEMILKILSQRTNYFKKNWNKINVIMIILAIINNSFQINVDIKSYDNFYKIFGGIAWGFQLIRVYRVLVHLKVMKKLLNSFFGAVSNIFGLSTLVILFLFISVLLGMNLFPYIKNQKTIDDYDANFNSFIMSLLTLVRISTSEMWYPIIAECAAQQTSIFVCRNDIYTYDDYVKYGKNSCGSNLSYFFFNAYYFVFTIFILNILIASIILSYKEGYIQEESAINLYQLDDIKKLWANFDPEGRGFINYKLFWQFSSQIAQIFGINQEDLLDVSLKRKFLQRLNIPMFEDPYNKTLVYKFHDVIIKLAEISLKIKYQIEKQIIFCQKLHFNLISYNSLEPDNKDIKRFHKRILLRQDKIKNIQYYQKSMFRSKDMVVIITIIRKIKEWKRRYLEKENDYQIFDIKNLTKKLQLFKQQEIQSQQSSEQQQIKEIKNSNSFIQQKDEKEIINSDQLAQQSLYVNQNDEEIKVPVFILKEQLQMNHISKSNKASNHQQDDFNIASTNMENKTVNSDQKEVYEQKSQETEESIIKSQPLQIDNNNQIMRRSSIFKKEAIKQQQQQDHSHQTKLNSLNMARYSKNQSNTFIQNVQKITIQNYDEEDGIQIENKVVSMIDQDQLSSSSSQQQQQQQQIQEKQQFSQVRIEEYQNV